MTGSRHRRLTLPLGTTGLPQTTDQNMYFILKRFATNKGYGERHRSRSANEKLGKYSMSVGIQATFDSSNFRFHHPISLGGLSTPKSSSPVCNIPSISSMSYQVHHILFVTRNPFDPDLADKASPTIRKYHLLPPTPRAMPACTRTWVARVR